MLVVGTNDRMALGKSNVHKDDPDKTLAMFTDTIAKMACKDNVTLVPVPRGGHNPFDGPKAVFDENKAAIIAAVAAFVAKTA